MNILVIGKFAQDQFGFHISDTLKDMGHKTFEFDPSLEYKYSRTTLGRRLHQFNHTIYNNLISTGYFREKRKKRILQIIAVNGIDLTISTHDFLYPDEVSLIKEKTQAPIVMWFPDSVAGFQKGMFFISDYDFLFFKDPYIVETLKSDYNKKNVYYLPECCNPKYHKPVELTPEDLIHYGCDITTYGNPHNIRSSFFQQLIDYNYKIKIWGHQSPAWLKNEKIKSLYTGEYVFNETKAKSVLAAKVNLNTLHPTEIYGVNARTFEVAAIGGFQLVHYRPGLSELFEDGNEIVSFRNYPDLLEKLNFFIDNQTKCKEIGNSGKEKAHKNHTYQLRLTSLFNQIT